MSATHAANVTVSPGRVTLAELREIARSTAPVALGEESYAAVEASARALAGALAEGSVIYGVNTGFGKLAHVRIPERDLVALQQNLIASHRTGVGAPLPDDAVRLILALKAIGLGRGYSGVRRELVDALLALVAHRIYPLIPGKGSVGASGDLTPLAHLSAALLGAGQVRCDGQVLDAAQALAGAGLAPLVLGPKEGLALLNGTQVSTGLALLGLFGAEDVHAAALVAGMLSLEAARGSLTPFDPRLQAVRGHRGQIDVAAAQSRLAEGSEIRAAHDNRHRVQDPYSLRCQPQVAGACLDSLRFAAEILRTEANAVSDNPIVFADTGEVLSGGNFHAEPVGFAADLLALVLAETGALSERRIALLVDSSISDLPAFLVRESGLNSGFMVAQITAAALVSENRTMAHPSVVDSIPTAANQEDHVSMATYGARRLLEMAENAASVVAIELLAAAQGVEFHAPLKTAPGLQRALALVRSVSAPLERDRPLAGDIDALRALILHGAFRELAGGIQPSDAG